MSLRIVGAGLSRTGTMSLKNALERLLGAPCYHMHELMTHPEHAPTWRDAMRGWLPDWEAFLGRYAAVLDDPATRFWRELAAAYPDAPVLLSRRDSAHAWYRSMDKTVLKFARELRAARTSPHGRWEKSPWWLDEGAAPEEVQAMDEMFADMPSAIFQAPNDRAALVAEYDRRLAEVRATIPVSRLVEWRPGDGWEPLCAALDLPVPDEPFPRKNSTAEFTTRIQEVAGLPEDGAPAPPARVAGRRREAPPT